MNMPELLGVRMGALNPLAKLVWIALIVSVMWAGINCDPARSCHGLFVQVGLDGGLCWMGGPGGPASVQG